MINCLFVHIITPIQLYHAYNMRKTKDYETDNIIYFIEFMLQ